MSNEEIKGEYMGLCNRTACQTPPATHYNYSTRKYYCSSCADIINAANRTDAMRLFGHDLCLEGLYVEQAPPPPVQSEQDSEYCWPKVFEITQQEVLKGEPRRKLIDLLNSKFIISAKNVQSDSGVEEVIKEISKKYHDCTCGEIYLSRKLTAPDCILCNADFESVAIEYATLKTKDLREALEEIEKSLYIGDDLNDKEILHFYVEVVKTIKKEIHKALNNKQ